MPGIDRTDPGGTFQGSSDPSTGFAGPPTQDSGGFGYWYNRGTHNSARPNPPRNFTAVLQPDDVTITLSAQADGFSVQNNYWTGLEFRFYFTPATSTDLSGLTSPDEAAAAFARSRLIASSPTISAGGHVSVNVNGAALGLGVFWATVVATYSTFGSAESHPAGPVFLASSDFQNTLDYVIPDDVTNFAAKLTLSPVPGTTLLYVAINFTYTAPSSFSFDGVTLWLTGYFSNKPGWAGTLEEGPFFKYRPEQSGADNVWVLQADYDSSASNYLNSAHSVVAYCSAVSRGRTYKLPISGRPNVNFASGIGA